DRPVDPRREHRPGHVEGPDADHRLHALGGRGLLPRRHREPRPLLVHQRPPALRPVTGRAAMNRRAGVTLLEVLVAIMITGVGMLALMTLFPLGAMEMAQSVKDDRAGHIKHNAATRANIDKIRLDPMVQAAMLNPGGG